MSTFSNDTGRDIFKDGLVAVEKKWGKDGPGMRFGGCRVLRTGTSSSSGKSRRTRIETPDKPGVKSSPVSLGPGL